jgi:pimeloyl-ACP methyl ester carboxylesterase
MIHTVRAGQLDIAYWDQGPRKAPVVVLLHGFPYDVLAYAKASAILAQAGRRVITPYLRGFGPTRKPRLCGGGGAFLPASLRPGGG